MKIEADKLKTSFELVLVDAETAKKSVEGGAAAILLSLDPRVKRVVANCPVVDWGILDEAEKAETSRSGYAE